MKLIPQTVYTESGKSDFEVNLLCKMKTGTYPLFQCKVSRKFGKYILSKDELVELLSDAFKAGCKKSNFPLSCDDKEQFINQILNQ